MHLEGKHLEKWRSYDIISWNNTCKNCIEKIIYVQSVYVNHFESLKMTENLHRSASEAGTESAIAAKMEAG